MTGVMESFDDLLVVAGQGAPFRMDQVFNGSRQGSDPSAIFGVGYDFEEDLTVPDIVEGKTTEAVARLRVIAAGDGSLFLRTWLDWTPSDGLAHKSYACYQISRDAAGRLATTDPALYAEASESELEDFTGSDEELINAAAEALFGAFDEAASYNADWQQTLPGYGFDEEVDDETAARHGEYHTKVIRGLGGTRTPVTCMLSDTDLGGVSPDELGAILDWVRTQPQVAA